MSGVDEDSVDKIQHLVASGARQGPWTQLLARLQDFLGDDIEVGPDRTLQRCRIGFRVSQPVDMVDAQSLDEPSVDQIEDQRVGAFEHRRMFDPHAGEAVDVEETTIVHVTRRDAPIGQPIALAFEQPVHRAEALGYTRSAVEDRHSLVDRLGDLAALSQHCETVLQLLAGGDDVVAPMFGLRSKGPQLFGNSQQPIDALAALRRVNRNGAIENVRVCQRADRERVLEERNGERSRVGVEAELQVAFLERFAVLRAEIRRHQLAVSAEPFPIDVEGVGVR